MGDLRAAHAARRSPTPSFSINDVTVQGPQTGTVHARFTVTLANPDIQHISTVDYQTADGTATGNIDGTAAPRAAHSRLTPTCLPRSLHNQVLADTLNPNDLKFENFTVNLSNPQFANITKGTGTATIDDTTVPGAVQFASPTYSVNNDQATASIGVVRFGGFADAVNVQFATVPGGTAIPNVDYIPTSGSVQFGPDQASNSFNITILPNDLLSGDKTADLQLTNPGGGSILASQVTAVLTIHPTINLVVLNTNDSGHGSLRQVITTANSLPGEHTITFDIPGTGPFTIIPLSPLPMVTAHRHDRRHHATGLRG